MVSSAKMSTLRDHHIRAKTDLAETIEHCIPADDGPWADGKVPRLVDPGSWIDIYSACNMSTEQTKQPTTKSPAPTRTTTPKRLHDSPAGATKVILKSVVTEAAKAHDFTI
jgi:hypothetical protein